MLAKSLLIAPLETKRSEPGESTTLKKLTNRRDDVQGEVFRVVRSMSYPGDRRVNAAGKRATLDEAAAAQLMA